LGADIGCFTWLGPAALLLSALLGAGYLLPISISGFFPGADYAPDAIERAPLLDPCRSMLMPIVALTTAAILFGIIPGALLNAFESIAIAIL